MTWEYLGQNPTYFVSAGFSSSHKCGILQGQQPTALAWATFGSPLARHMGRHRATLTNFQLDWAKSTKMTCMHVMSAGQRMASQKEVDLVLLEKGIQGAASCGRQLQHELRGLSGIY